MKQLSARGTLAASSAGFFAVGILTAVLGPALPNLASNTSSTLVAIGSLFTALFLGSLASQFVAGPLNDRIGQRPVLIVGVALLAAGMLVMTFSRSLPVSLAAIFVAGLGHGAVDISTNVLIAEVYADRSAWALNLVNVFFGIGAFVGPALAGFALQWWGTAVPAIWFGVGLLLILALLAPFMAVPANASLVHGSPERVGTLFRSARLWMFGALMLVYVGTEVGLGGWISTYLERSTAVAATTAAFATSGFWLALTVGRIGATVLAARVDAQRLLVWCLIGAVAGGVLLIVSTGSLLPTIAAVLLLGASFGPIFPTGLSLVTARFRSAPGTAASVVVAMGSGGGMLLPWLQGVLLERSGPAASVALVAAMTVAMLALNAARRLLPEHAPKPMKLAPTRRADADC